MFFFFDTKIHTREHLNATLDNIPVIGEIPFVKPEFTENIPSAESRSPIAESVRMIIANLNFILFNSDSKNNIILVSSSIKGEGKTLVSTNLASGLSAKYNKILLIGADLRNPQIHKLIGVKKNKLGLSDLIYHQDNNYSKYIFKFNSFDVMLSGTIPPNPTEMLASKSFTDFLKKISSEYDYIIIDSAPCLLVSDTFEISKFADTTVFVTRSNHTDKSLIEFINECKNQNRLQNMSIVLNGIGNSSKYGYGYAYQYGYKYNYSYNYGYGYGNLKDIIIYTI